MKSFLLLACLSTLLVQINSAATCSPPVITLSLGACNVSITDGENQDTVYSWGMLLVVGETQIIASPSTFVSTPLFDHEDVCSIERRGKASAGQCRSRRGNYLPAAKFAPASLDGLKNMNPNIDAFNISIQKATSAPIQLLPGTSIDVTSGIVTNWENHTNGHFPLTRESTIMDQLQRAGVARSFALDVGPQNYISQRKGRLTLGGWQPEMVKGPFIKYDMRNYSQTLKGRLCPLQVGIQSLFVTIGNRTHHLIKSDTDHVACIEPYDRLFRLDSVSLDQIKDEIKNTHGLEEVSDGIEDPRGRYDDVLDLEPGLVYRTEPNASIADIMSSMQITLSGGLTVNLTAEDLVQPLRGLDSRGAPITKRNLTEVMVYRESGIGNAAVLGRTLLSKLYMFVDYEKSELSLGLLDQNAILQAPISSGTCGKSLTDQDKGLISLGVIVFALVVAIGVLVFFFQRKVKRQETQLIQLGADGPAVIVEEKPPGTPPHPKPRSGY